METKVFPAILSSLDQIMQYMRDVIYNSSICPREGKKFEVALEEAVVNIIHYAYQTPSGVIEIACSLDDSKENIVVYLKDRGIPFNPLEKEEVSPPKDLDSQKIGGLGIHFIKKMVDLIDYKFENGENTLILIKKI